MSDSPKLKTSTFNKIRIFTSLLLIVNAVKILFVRYQLWFIIKPWENTLTYPWYLHVQGVFQLIYGLVMIVMSLDLLTSIHYNKRHGKELVFVIFFEGLLGFLGRLDTVYLFIERLITTPILVTILNINSYFIYIDRLSQVIGYGLLIIFTYILYTGSNIFSRRSYKMLFVTFSLFSISYVLFIMRRFSNPGVSFSILDPAYFLSALSFIILSYGFFIAYNDDYSENDLFSKTSLRIFKTAIFMYGVHSLLFFGFYILNFNELQSFGGFLTYIQTFSFLIFSVYYMIISRYNWSQVILKK